MAKRRTDDLNCVLPRKRFFNQKMYNANVLCSHEILTDVTGKQWQLGRRIGTGGFGIIFLVSEILNQEVTNDAKYICKIEEHLNGPLFVERNCYLRIAKLETIEQWKMEYNMKSLGMPHYVASGSHTVKNNKYRFLIIPKYDCDLEQIFTIKGKKFNIKTVCLLGMQLLNILEYIHDKGYIHADIKASNILLKKKNVFTKSFQYKSSPYKSGIGIRYHGTAPLRKCKLRNLPIIHRSLRPNEHLKILSKSIARTNTVIENCKENDQVYLLDYGLATKYVNPDNSHKLYCRDERKAHAGTILFCSVDAHIGAQSRRSDLECLGYNLIYWLTGTLPWEDSMNDPEIVEKKKLKCLNNLKEFLIFTFNEYPKFIYDYFICLKKLEFHQKPDYGYFKNLFKNAIIEHGYKDDDTFDFDSLEKCTKRMKRANIENKHKARAVALMCRSPLRANMAINHLRKRLGQKMSWAKILVDPEVLIKAKHREKKSPELNENISSNSIHNLDIYSLNPTPAMLEVYKRSQRKLNNNGTPRSKGDRVVTPIDGYNRAMMDVHIAMEQRKEAEYEKMLVINNNNNNNSIKTKRKTNQKNKRKTQVIITRSISHHVTRSELQRKNSESGVNIYRLRS